MSHRNALHSLLWLVVILAFTAVACEPTDAELGKNDEQGALAEFLSAEDFDRVIQDAEVLCLDGVVEAAFTEPDQMFGFPFNASAGATVWAATEGDADFDTILMLFGPDDGTGYFGRYPIALDDDGGEGLLSDLEQYEIKEDGRYVLVVGTYGGEYRGTVQMRLAINGSDGCNGGSEPELVCCLLPMGYPEPCFDENGEFDADGDGVPDDCYNEDMSWMVEEMLVLPMDDCLDMGGEPAPLELCEEPPVPEEVCCMLAFRADDPDCYEADGTNRCGGEPEYFMAGLDECLEMGGQPVGLEMCTGEPYPEEVCCLFPADDGQEYMRIMPMEECEMMGGLFLPVEECQEPQPEEVCCALPTAEGMMEDMFVVPLEECLEMGGLVLPMEECREPEPEEVCCLVPTPDGLEEWFITSIDECMDQGGVPLPVEECGEPQPEEVCCLAYVDWAADDPSCWGPDGENWCGEPEPFITSAEECEAMGGEFLPMEECRDPQQEEVCCVLYGDNSDPNCWDETGDPTLCGEGEMFIAGMEDCLAMGGEALPVEECYEPQPEEVCCFLFNEAGEFRAVLIPEGDCLDMGGEPAPMEECVTPEPVEVCCVVLDEAGNEREVFMTSEEECMDMGGEIVDDAACGGQPQPEEVCCFLVDPETGEMRMEVLPEDVCMAERGEAAPLEECTGEPNPDPEPVCCFVMDAAGQIWTGWMDADACAERGGMVSAVEELCGARP